MNTSYIMVDVEADGPIPGDYSMVLVGAVVVEPGHARSFRGALRPISGSWVPAALAVSGLTREQTMAHEDPEKVMTDFERWLSEVCPGGRPLFVSDNNGFDWMFVCWYFQHFLGRSPFGHSSTNLGSLYKGLVRDTTKNFKHLRRTRHSHDPVDDARGNVEAMLHMVGAMSLRTPNVRIPVDPRGRGR